MEYSIHRMKTIRLPRSPYRPWFGLSRYTASAFLAISQVMAANTLPTNAAFQD